MATETASKRLAVGMDRRFLETTPSDGTTFGTPFDLNLIGLKTLYLKEVRRFLKVFGQTLVAPLVTTLIFLAIFAMALGGAARQIGGIPYLQFLAPGLIMMAIVQNAFANTSSAILIAKVQGNIVDYLMPPLSPGEIVFGVVAGGVTRGVLVGIVVGLAMIPVVDLQVGHPFLLIHTVVMAATMLSLLGLIGGLWAEKFDQMAAVTNYVITPLSFLSGTFYSIHDLPEPFHLLALINPFFYMIDGIRFAITGHADGQPWLGALILTVTVVALWYAAYRALASGWRLKA
ncbi:MAG TPA: ABC transporter permease [Geminicoccus sp.]|jgi:ABC-2 type transport system permease protein|uniref:ABC transporter permease n=1 Tax=Geminicoccus sp. TaxID=2024832 RepID=UPI002E35A9D1|nr:ABC transporter permease [Geminicoccus sp.]HEX2527249.1 ABC transporter permease [Geminicoccus sp.]